MYNRNYNNDLLRPSDISPGLPVFIRISNPKTSKLHTPFC